MTITPETAAQNIIETMRDYLIVLDEDKNIALVNQACLHAVGYTKDELIGKKYTLIFKEDLAFDHHETILNTKDGQSLPVVFNVSSLHNSMILVLRDMREMNALIKKL
jgi:PAS domain S-box-containing protein